MFKLYGDGVHDDTNAIQEIIDSGICEVCLPVPKNIILYQNRLNCLLISVLFCRDSLKSGLLTVLTV